MNTRQDIFIDCLPELVLTSNAMIRTSPFTYSFSPKVKAICFPLFQESQLWKQFPLVFLFAAKKLLCVTTSGAFLEWTHQKVGPQFSCVTFPAIAASLLWLLLTQIILFFVTSYRFWLVTPAPGFQSHYLLLADSYCCCSSEWITILCLAFRTFIIVITNTLDQIICLKYLEWSLSSETTVTEY